MVSIHSYNALIFTAKCKKKQYLRVHWQKSSFSNYDHHGNNGPRLMSMLLNVTMVMIGAAGCSF